MTTKTRDKVAALGGTPIFDTALPIVRPTFPPLELYAAKFQDALSTGQVTNNCQWAREFEDKLSEYLDVPTAVFCNGQAALLAMLKAFDLEGKEVIVPSFTFSATPHAVKWCGGIPVFADILDDGSMVLDPRDVEKRITANTVAIMGVDPYGLTCDYDALDRIGKKHNLKVIYDSAPSFGSLVGGKPVGRQGAAQIFSFHATKAFATMEGGCVCTTDANIMARVKAIRNFGLQDNGDCLEPGFNGKMTEISALIGLEQLKNFFQVAKTRRKSAERMQAGLQKIPGVSVARAHANEDPIWLYFPVVIDAEKFGLNRDELADALKAENLLVRKYYSPPCHHMTLYKQEPPLVLPVTEKIAYNVIALPVYNDMTESECDGIVRAFDEIQKAASQIKSRAV